MYIYVHAYTYAIMVCTARHAGEPKSAQSVKQGA